MRCNYRVDADCNVRCNYRAGVIVMSGIVS